jgi:hypothetical protein
VLLGGGGCLTGIEEDNADAFSENMDPELQDDDADIE